MEGWIKLHRKLVEWEWHDMPEMVSVLLHLLLLANHEDSVWHGVTICRGQLVTGRKELSKITGISEQTVRTCLNRLKSTNEITIQSTNRYSIITICNYDKYQILEDVDNQQTNQQTNQQLTSNQPTTNQQLTTNKNEKNEKNINNLLLLTAHTRDCSLGFIQVDSVAEYILSQSTQLQQEAWFRLYYQYFAKMPDNDFLTAYSRGFQDQLITDGVREKEKDGVFKHFTNWLRVRFDEELKQRNNTNNKKQQYGYERARNTEMEKLPDGFSIYEQ